MPLKPLHSFGARMLPRRTARAMACLMLLSDRWTRPFSRLVTKRWMSLTEAPELLGYLPMAL